MAAAPRPLFANLAELERRRAGRPLFLFLDFDGTLAPIVSEPERAGMTPGMRDALVQVAARMPVAIVSGRDRADVAARVAMPELIYAGSHGLDIAGPGGLALQHPAGVAAVAALDAAEAALRVALAQVPGALCERKRFTLAVHHRLTPRPRVPEVERAVADEVARHPALHATRGKEVLELRPQFAWHKGSAVGWILEHAGGANAGAGAGADAGAGAASALFPIYVGDDVTDEDGFRAVAGRGLGVRVADERALVGESAADFTLADPGEVEQLLRHLAPLG